jgi:hypothetical protein
MDILKIKNTIRKKRIKYILLLNIAVAIVTTGLFFNPSFIAKYLSSDGILEKTTVIEIYILEYFIIAFGFVVCLYSLFKVFGSNMAYDLIRVIFVFSTSFPLLIVLFFFLYCTVRIWYQTPIDYFNEGWNVIHASKFMSSGLLYSPLSSLPITPVNYPPLSFMIIGILSYYTGLPLLQTGRLVSLISHLLIFYFIFRIIINLTSKKSAAFLGALLWIILMVIQARPYIGMYDPQILAHTFAIGALCLYSKWIDNLTPQRTCMLALLCCLGLFIKHLVIVVPTVLVITLFFTNKKHFKIFFLTEIALFSLMILGIWIYWGEHFFSNFIEFYRPYSKERAIRTIASLLFNNAILVILLPFIISLFKFQKKQVFALIYFSFSFLFGSYVVGGAGVGSNAWFDLFIASAIVSGLLAAEVTKLKVFWTRILIYGVLSSCFLPFFVNYQAIMDEILSYDKLKEKAETYQKTIEILQSIEGQTLVDEPLLAFHARKEFLFDPFLGSIFIASGRINEKILTNPIHERYFSTIVLYFDLEKALSKINNYNAYSEPKISTYHGWTDRTLKVINDNYELLKPKSSDSYYIYLPRKNR